MSDLDTALGRLADAGVRRIVYFHCDHFEPWSDGVSERQAERTQQFFELTASTWHTQRLTLFYLPFVDYTTRAAPSAPPERLHGVEGDGIAFIHPDAHDRALRRAAMAPLHDSGHGLEVHMHHEGFLRSGLTVKPDVRAWVDAHSTDTLEAARFRVGLETYLDEIRADCDLPLETWMFIHGKWALNGSDPEVCRVQDEIIELQRRGGLADFSFPAGRPHVDPTVLNTPYTIRPCVAERCYDLPQAAPLAIGQPGAGDAGRFLIWHTRLSHPWGSLDYHSPVILQNSIAWQDLALRWLQDSPVHGDAVYIKTYAHSMNPHYWESGARPTLPHHLYFFEKLFCELRRQAEARGMAFELAHAGEVTRALLDPAQTPATQVFAPRPAQVSERDLQDEMEALWKAPRGSQDKARACLLAERLWAVHGTPQAALRLALSCFEGHSRDKNIDQALMYLNLPAVRDMRGARLIKTRIFADPDYVISDPKEARALLDSVWDDPQATAKDALAARLEAGPPATEKGTMDVTDDNKLKEEMERLEKDREAARTRTEHFYLHEFSSYDRYREVQILHNKRKIDVVWADEDTMDRVADIAAAAHPGDGPIRGICHGTRNGFEQRYLNGLGRGIQAIGTEISDTATDFEDTVQWDFHDVNPEWEGAFDFVYSNSFDHAWKPREALAVWLNQLTDTGVVIIEHTRGHGPTYASEMDPFGVDPIAMPYYLSQWFGMQISISHSVAKKKGMDHDAWLFVLAKHVKTVTPLE